MSTQPTPTGSVFTPTIASSPTASFYGYESLFPSPDTDPFTGLPRQSVTEWPKFTYLPPTASTAVERKFAARMKSRQRPLPCSINLFLTRSLLHVESDPHRYPAR